MNKLRFQSKPPVLKKNVLRAAPKRVAAHYDLERLPSFDGSNEYLQLLYFATAPVAGERYYFSQNSKIDSKRVTFLNVHYNNTRFLGDDFDMYATYKDDSVTYNVITFADYKSLLLSLADMQDEMRLERCPASTFLIFPNAPLTLQAPPKARKPLDLYIGTRNCFVEFTQAPTTVAPFIIPVSIYYEE